MDLDDSALYRIMGERLRQARVAAGLTQVELAARAGVMRTSLANIEVGRQKAPLHVLYQLCLSLGIEASTLFPANALVRRDGVDEETIPIDVDGKGTIKRVPPRAAAFVLQLMED